MSVERTWEPPGPGQWYASPEHLPEPVSTLGGELLEILASGWRTGTDRYGLPPNTGTFAESNRWWFYGRRDPGPLDLDAMEAAAADALAPANRAKFGKLGFRLHAVALDEIEKAGGSLRCCVGEVF